MNWRTYLAATLVGLAIGCVSLTTGRKIQHEPIHLIIENNQADYVVIEVWCGARRAARITSHVTGEVIRKDVPYAPDCSMMHITTGTNAEVRWQTQRFHVAPGSEVHVVTNDSNTLKRFWVR